MPKTCQNKFKVQITFRLGQFENKNLPFDLIAKKNLDERHDAPEKLKEDKK